MRAAPRRTMPNQAAAARWSRSASAIRPRGNSCTAMTTARPNRAKPNSERADRRGLPGTHRITPPWTSALTTLPHQRDTARWLEDAERVDVALYAAIAQTPTPALDARWRGSRTPPTTPACRWPRPPSWRRPGAAAGGAPPRCGLASVGVTATIVNLGMKPLGRRRAPRPRGRTGPGRPPRADAVLDLVSLRATPPPRSRSRPASATCSRRRRSRCTGSRRSSPTRASTPASTIPATSSPAR